MGPDFRTTFGDLCLEEHDIVVETILDDPPQARLDATDVPGRDGSVLVDATLGCRVFGEEWHDFDEVVSMLGTHLCETAELEVRSHPGERYMATLTSVTTSYDERQGGTGLGYLELGFVAHDPYRYGATRSYEFSSPSGSSNEILIGGNVPTRRVTLKSNKARGWNDIGVHDTDQSGVWGFVIDGSFEVLVVIPRGREAASYHTVNIDFEKRSASVDGQTTTITLGSDWPDMKPGRHVLTFQEGSFDSSAGHPIIEWTERYV